MTRDLTEIALVRTLRLLRRLAHVGRHHFHRVGVAHYAACSEPDRWRWQCCGCPVNVTSKYSNISETVLGTDADEDPLYTKTQPAPGVEFP